MSDDSILDDDDSAIEEVCASIEQGDMTVDEAAQQLTGEGEAERASNVMRMLPVHAAPYTARAPTAGKGGGDHLKVQRRVGRPRKVERMPTTSDLEYHALMSEEKAKFIDVDPVVEAARTHKDPMAMLAIIKAEVAKESAALHFQRIENEKYGKDTSQVSSRRIDALGKIANIELEMKKLGADTVDVHGESFQRVFQLWIDKIREIVEQTLPPEQVDLFFNRLSTALEGWEDQVSSTLR
jgi:hypothetical protein